MMPLKASRPRPPLMVPLRASCLQKKQGGFRRGRAQGRARVTGDIDWERIFSHGPTPSPCRGRAFMSRRRVRDHACPNVQGPPPPIDTETARAPPPCPTNVPPTTTQMCKANAWHFLRLDGSSKAVGRQPLVDRFNQAAVRRGLRGGGGRQLSGGINRGWGSSSWLTDSTRQQ